MKTSISIILFCLFLVLAGIYVSFMWNIFFVPVFFKGATFNMIHGMASFLILAAFGIFKEANKVTADVFSSQTEGFYLSQFSWTSLTAIVGMGILFGVSFLLSFVL